MIVQIGFNTKSVFFILSGFTVINHGISKAAAQQYTATVEIAELKASPDSEYFDVEGKLPELSLYVLKEIQPKQNFFFEEFLFDKNGKKKRISTISLLCDELITKDSTLRNQVISTFLFPGKRCPLKLGRILPPASKTLSFDYNGYSVSCEPWKYTLELSSGYSKQPYMTLTVNVKMEKKNVCG